MKKKMTMNVQQLFKESTQEFCSSHFYTYVTRKEFLFKCNKKNIFDIPKVQKIVISCTSKAIIEEKHNMIPALVALEMISGQKAVPLSAKKSIAAFQIRQHTLIGCKVTLRGEKMYAFLEKFHSVLLPRLQETQALTKKNFTSQGHFSIGCENIFIFPELENHFEEFESIVGLTISFSLSSLTKDEGRRLAEGYCFLSSFAFPLAFSE